MAISIASTPVSQPDFRSQLVTALLAVKPIAAIAKRQARHMMIKRAESLGVPWLSQVAALQNRDWQADFIEVQNPNLVYPDYYLTSFHAYDQGNLCWQAATEVEVAAYAVHARIWPEAGAGGDARLRQSYHDHLVSTIATPPATILDLGCGVGMSTVALQTVYPQAQVTGVDLSPYFLAIARQRNAAYPCIRWLHAAAEATGLPDASVDLVSLCLVCHELPQQASQDIIQEAYRLLRPGGHLAIMDMNPQSQAYATMPPYILTLLKSTEPYLDAYFGFDIAGAIADAGFTLSSLVINSPRHRSLIAQVPATNPFRAVGNSK